VGRLACHTRLGLDDKVHQEQVAEMGKGLGPSQEVVGDYLVVAGQAPGCSIGVEAELPVAQPRTGCRIKQRN